MTPQSPPSPPRRSPRRWHQSSQTPSARNRHPLLLQDCQVQEGRTRRQGCGPLGDARAQPRSATGRRRPLESFGGVAVLEAGQVPASGLRSRSPPCASRPPRLPMPPAQPGTWQHRRWACLGARSAPSSCGPSGLPLPLRPQATPAPGSGLDVTPRCPSAPHGVSMRRSRGGLGPAAWRGAARPGPPWFALRPPDVPCRTGISRGRRRRRGPRTAPHPRAQPRPRPAAGGTPREPGALRGLHPRGRLLLLLRGPC
mmetsp:Transcript_99064/g.295968  ORF Transcript_99064/g.295968 Transcript_99064/m.295968 type:complete len:255 (+) Transcript_99064:319-1083(+)